MLNRSHLASRDLRIRHVDGQIALRHLGQRPKHSQRLIQCHFKKEKQATNISGLGHLTAADQNTCRCPFNVVPSTRSTFLPADRQLTISFSKQVSRFVARSGEVFKHLYIVISSAIPPSFLCLYLKLQRDTGMCLPQAGLHCPSPDEDTSAV